MSVEAIRGCGYRKVSGLYLCGEGHGMACDRLPYELEVCPVCGAGVNFSRGFTLLNWLEYAEDHSAKLGGLPGNIGGNYPDKCKCPLVCPVCHPDELNQPYGLLWVGESFYTPEAFIQEALEMGVSRRIAAIPKNLKLGETWVLFATIKACGEKRDENGKLEGIPGVFYAFRPQRLELLIWKSEFTHDKAVELEKKHITPILIPDGDVEHDPRTGLKPKEGDEDTIFFDNLRNELDGMRDKLRGVK